jgi:hypothetical protein
MLARFLAVMMSHATPPPYASMPVISMGPTALQPRVSSPSDPEPDRQRSSGIPFTEHRRDQARRKTDHVPVVLWLASPYANTVADAAVPASDSVSAGVTVGDWGGRVTRIRAHGSATDANATKADTTVFMAARRKAGRDPPANCAELRVSSTFRHHT